MRQRISQGSAAAEDDGGKIVGKLTMTTNLAGSALDSIKSAGAIARATLESSHLEHIRIGESMTISRDDGYNGNYTVLDMLDDTPFTFAKPASAASLAAYADVNDSFASRLGSLGQCVCVFVLSTYLNVSSYFVNKD